MARKGQAKQKTSGLKSGMLEARYRVCLRMVKSGETTWEELEAAGVARRRRPGPKSAEREAVEEALERFRKGKSKPTTRRIAGDAI